MGHAADGEVHRPRHAVSGSVGTITDKVSARIVLADPDLPPSVCGDGAGEATRRSPDNVRIGTADASTGIATNIVGERVRGAAADGVEVLAIGISRAVHDAVGEIGPLFPVQRCSGQSCQPGQRWTAHARERRCVRNAFHSPAKRVKRY